MVRRVAIWMISAGMLVAQCSCATSSHQRESDSTQPEDMSSGLVEPPAPFVEPSASMSMQSGLSEAHGRGKTVAFETRAEQAPSVVDLNVIAAQEEQGKAPESFELPVPPQLGIGRTDSDDPEETLPRLAVLTLEDVLRSVYDSYPLLRIAVEQRRIAEGQLLEAHGEFDLKLKGGGTSGALGYYQTNRLGTGLEQALFGGGDVFAGYRIGRGNFEPWYGGRETNDGGEFAAGFLIPLLRNRHIDTRRAAIFRAALGRDSVEPDILLQLLDFVRSASYAYWDWVAAGQGVRIEQALLDLALQRQDGMKKHVARGNLPRIELTDNERLIASRRAALIDAQRKFRQSAIKLSLFLRAPNGQPQLPPPDSQRSLFPEALPYEDEQLDADIQSALASRPETQFLDFVRQQLEVELAQARNLYLPEVSVGATASKDVGAAASSKGDKTPFQLEASLLISAPLQRRKALGKLQATQSKLLQIRTKAQFERDKIMTDVQNAVTALKAAHERIAQARQSAALNRTMEEAERRVFVAGDSNLLIVNLREKATADARKILVAAQLEYCRAEADLRAALGTVPMQNP